MVAAGGPLRAEGFPKRRCQFEFVAAQPHLIPRRPATCAHLFPTGCITVYGGQVYQFFAFFAVFQDAYAFFIHLA